MSIKMFDVYQQVRKDVDIDQLFYSLEAADNINETFDFVLKPCEKPARILQV